MNGMKAARTVIKRVLQNFLTIRDEKVLISRFFASLALDWPPDIVSTLSSPTYCQLEMRNYR